MKSLVSPRAIAALRHKEALESRPAFVAGACIFIAVPLLWSLLATAMDSQHDAMPGILATMLLGFGWIYGAIVGAQLVCRDLGRPTGRFLLAHPVLPQDAMRAKLTIGFRQLLGLIVIIGLVEFLLLRFVGRPLWLNLHHPVEDLITRLALGGLATMAAFCLSFTAAAITRNTLVAAIFTALLFVLFVALPFISSAPLRFIQTAEFLLMIPISLLGIPQSPGALFLILAIIGVALWLVTRLALSAATWTSRLRLGTKSIAWTVAALIVFVFCAGLNEVGTTIPVSSTQWGVGDELLMTLSSIVATPGHVARAYDSLVRLTDVDSDGRIHDSGYVDLRHSRKILGCERTRLSFRGNELFALTSDRRALFEPPQSRPEFWVCLDRIDATTHVAESLGDLPLEGPLRGAVDVYVIDFAATADTLAVALAVSFEIGPLKPGFNPPVDSIEYRAFLALYDTSNVNGNPATSASKPLRFRRAVEFWTNLRGSSFFGDAWNAFVQGADGRTYFITGSGFYDVTNDRRLNIGVTSSSNIIPVSQEVIAMSTANSLICERHAPAEVAPDGSLIRASHRETLGTQNLSPLAALLDNTTILFSPGQNQVWAKGRNSLTGFDVSDPTHPRRIGHVTTFNIVQVAACKDFIVLDHGAGISIVKIPK